MKRTSRLTKSVYCFIIFTIILLNSMLIVTATSEKTYSYLSDNGTVITFMPAEKKVKIEPSSDWRTHYINDWRICALYSNGRMTTCSIEPAYSDNEDVILNIDCLDDEHPIICKVFVFDENCAPQISATICDLYNQAYCVEDGTFDYFAKFDKLTNDYDYSLTKLQQEISILEESGKISQEKIKQARIDLEKLPTQKNSYISSRTSYHIANGAGGSMYAMEMAKRDWENYYTSQTAKLNSVIITEEENVTAYSTQIESKKIEFELLTTEHKNSVDKLKEEYPDAGNGINGGTYFTDNYTYEGLLQILKGKHDSELVKLEEELTALKGIYTESRQKITQARIDLANLPTQKNSYISSRTYYHMANGAGGSMYAMEMAKRDWENYYTSQTANLNSVIIIEEENVTTYSKQIADKENEIEQCCVQFEADVISLKNRFGVE